MSVPSPRISLFANMLAWISICVPLSEHVHVCLSCKGFFFFSHALVFMHCISECISVYVWCFTRKKNPGKIVCTALSHMPDCFTCQCLSFSFINDMQMTCIC